MEDSAELTAALDQVRDRCACAHAVAFTIALADIVSEIGHSNDHVPALRGLLALCDEFPVPHRRVLPVHVKSARAMLLEIRSALLPKWLRPVAPEPWSGYSPWGDCWGQRERITLAMRKLNLRAGARRECTLVARLTNIHLKRQDLSALSIHPGPLTLRFSVLVCPLVLVEMHH